jgi:hypothetical protein
MRFHRRVDSDAGGESLRSTRQEGDDADEHNEKARKPSRGRSMPEGQWSRGSPLLSVMAEARAPASARSRPNAMPGRFRAASGEGMGILSRNGRTWDPK